MAAEDCTQKRCTKCGEVKTLYSFCKDKRNSDGRTSCCKRCDNAARSARNAANPIIIKNRREKHREQAAHKAREWYANNRDRARSAQANYRKENLEKVREKERIWRELNKDRILAKNRNRKAKLRNVPGSHDISDIRRIFTKQKGLCACCRSPISNGYHVDHITAIANGGTNGRENLQLLCAPCNLSKGSKDPIKFMQERGFLL